MSRIRRLSVRGIRNFGDDNEEATIRFSRPLTLILGPNGTGKTTIIEALKFATCGEFPPGSDRGKYFIHDPTLSSTSSVRGVVKAEIIDASGNMYTICRTIESTKSNVTMRFKTLDSALSRVNKGTKEVISITNRCANVDTELTLAMGVSKPILDYVIFCHQEDLSWPFQDGKKLKEKFDEIFDSTRFNKALESIMKYSKDLKQKAQILKEQKQSCQHIVSEVEEKEEKLEDHKKRLENSKVKVEELENELAPVSDKIKKLEKMNADYKDLLSEEKRKKAEYDMYKQQLDTLKEDMQYVFEGTTEELIKQIESYDEKIITRAQDIEELEERLKRIVGEECRISSVLATERVANGSLRQQVKDHERKVTLRNKILNETLSAWNLATADSNVSEIEVIALSKRIEDKMRELENKSDENRAKRGAEEKELQKIVDSLRSEHAKVESEKNLQENELSETRKEINRIKLEIIQRGTATSKLNAIETKIKEATVKIQELNETMNADAARKEISERIKSRDEMETLLNTLDGEIALLLKQSSLQAELELSKSTLHSKEKEIQNLANKHKEKIMTLLDIKELGETKLKSSLDTVQKELISEIESINQDIQTEERRSTTLETTILHTERELENAKNKISSDKKKMQSICDYKNFDEALLLQFKKMKDLQDKRGMYAHQSIAYKEYMKQLKETKPCCPLCHRGFNERESVVNLLKEMENEMKNHPSRLQECEKELKAEQEKYDKMLQLKPVVEKIIQFEDVELEKLTENLEKAKNRLNKCRANIMDLKEKKSGPDNKLTMCKDIIGDIMLWDRCIDEIFKLRQKINDFQGHLIAAGLKTERSLEEVQTQREELKMSLKNIRGDIEKIQSKINMHNEKMHNARQEQHALQEEQLKLRSDLQKVEELKDKQDALYSKEISLGTLVTTLRKKVATAETELNSAHDKLEKQKKDNSEKLDIDRKLLAEGTRRLSELQAAQDEVDAFVYRKIPDLLEKSEAKIQNYQETLNDLLHEKGETEAIINQFRDEASRQEVRRRELSDNLTLRKIMETSKTIKQQYLSIKEKLSAINYSEVVEECKNLQSREQSLLRQKNMVKGNQEELERAVEQYIQDLRKDIYRQARKSYKSKCIELTVAEEAILNLKAYSRALDTAMIEYHEERMATVNRIMKQMWKLVYTGTDTTSIEIRTDATEGIGSSRRTYNYKLVQTKHGHEIDMKGRCSAGQKVLASIIIRLALAETFCKDCGILALDEPTTNLDEENADSLANALATVIKLRSQHQKNFQLIVISHDEKFLFKLAELSSNKGFYQLYRKQSGYSAIKHCLVDSRDHFTSDAIKEEVSSEDETQESAGIQDKLQSRTSVQRKGSDESTSTRKRHVRDSDSDDHNEKRVSKKRYVFQ